MTLSSLYPVLGTEHLTASRDFYVALLEMQVSFENDWYISLVAGPQSPLQLAFVDYRHESVPAGDRKLPAGAIVTVEVDDATRLWERALAAGHEPVLRLRDEPWGQRHFMVRDPNDVLVDIVELIAPSEEFAASYTAS